MAPHDPSRRFLVVIPTIRQGLPGFAEAIQEIRDSFTQPTEVQVLDGKEGKTVVLNRAYDELLVPSDCDVYVTMDDDYIPGKDWQETICRAMAALPEVGAFGIWLGESPDMRDYMGAQLCGPEEVRNGVKVRSIGPTHHIAGAMIAFRKEVAVAIGKQPLSGLKYEIWEDAYRGRRVRVIGKDLIYLVGDTPRIRLFNDPPEYLAEKDRETAEGRKMVDEYLAKGGIRDPLALKIRRVLGGLKARVLGRK